MEEPTGQDEEEKSESTITKNNINTNTTSINNINTPPNETQLLVDDSEENVLLEDEIDEGRSVGTADTVVRDVDLLRNELMLDAELQELEEMLNKESGTGVNISTDTDTVFSNEGVTETINTPENVPVEEEAQPRRSGRQGAGEGVIRFEPDIGERVIMIRGVYISSFYKRKN